ncbi:iron permease FTR1 family protein [Mycobacterium avium subsp. hominissuis 10-4249]|nr:iron permease FTR1 family protein [Mycobacterium avium subsp. hominissuis 10-4249]
MAAVLAVAAPARDTVDAARTRTVTDRAGHAAAVSMATGPHGRELTVTPAGTSTVHHIQLVPADDQSVDGLPVQAWQASETAGVDGAPEITLDQLRDMTGGRLPVGLAAARTRGPFQGQWSTTTVYTVLTRGDAVISAKAASNRTAVLTGGGLTGAKTVSLGGLATDWSTSAAEDHATAAAIAAGDRNRGEGQLWNVWLPLVIAGFAVACALSALASVRVDRKREDERKAIDGEAHRRGNVPVS